LALLDPPLAQEVFEHASGVSELDTWLLNIGTWREKVVDPRAAEEPAEQLLYSVWEEFSRGLMTLLQKARVLSDIPKAGGVFSYFGGLSRCLVIQYEFVGTIPRLRPITLIQEPKSAFDSWGAIDEVAPTDRNAIKAIILSGHKIVNYRSLLIHIDRRRDYGVFGQSIDTLVIAELLAQRFLKTFQ
jgi:hypothetical protein